MNKPAALAAFLALMPAGTVAPAQQPDMTVSVRIVESVEDFQRWLQQPAPQAPYLPNLKEIPAGRKVHFPIIVQGIRAPQQGVVTLVADVEFFGPDGKSIAAAPQCCRYTITNAPDIRMAMLGPTINLEFQSGFPHGSYTVRATVSDGSRSASAAEAFQFIPPKAAEPPPAPAPAAAPKLQMGAPPAKNPGRDADKRDCLTLPTPAEVIKCTERK